MYKMDKTIYDINNGIHVGCGGTKTAILMKDNETVVFIPNSVDGPWLIDIWPRIIYEEFEMSELLENLGIPTLKFKLCKVKLYDGNYLDTYSCSSFESYVKDGNYIIDVKNTKSSTWPRNNLLSLIPRDFDRMDFDYWIKILKPLIHDLDILGDNGLYLSPDTSNLVFVSKKSQWHSGSELPFEIRLFTFDFASKNSILNISNKTPLKYSDIYQMLDRLVQYSVWEEFAQDKISLSEEQYIFYKKLTQISKKYLQKYDPYVKEDHHPCIIN